MGLKGLWMSLMVTAIHARVALAHYPFPCSEEEKGKAAQIEKAVAARSAEGVAALAQLLGDANARVQTAAALGLMRLSGASLSLDAPIQALRGLKEAKAPFLAAVAEVALTMLDKGTPVEERRAQLVKLTQSQEGRDGEMSTRRAGTRTAWLRRMAVEGLRELGDRSVLAALEDLRDDYFGEMDDTFDMRSVAVVAFEVWWGLRSAGLREDERLPVLVAALSQGEPFSSRWCHAACRVLEAAGEKAVPLLIPLLASKDRRPKLWAMRTLTHIGGKEATGPLLDVALKDVESEDSVIRSVALNALVWHLEKRCLPTLTRLATQSQDAHVRSQAIWAIARLGDESCVPVLKSALADPHELTRAHAAAGLARMGKSDGDDALLACLAGEWPATRAAALEGARHIKDQTRVRQRFLEVLRGGPEEGKLERDRLERVRNDVVRELLSWDKEKLRPLARISHQQAQLRRSDRV